MKLKRLFITSIVFILLLSGANVLGVSLNTELTANKYEIKAENEEEITVNLKLNEFKEIEKGIYAYKGQINYDKDVFFEIDETNFKTKNYWSNLEYNKANNEFVIIKKAGTKVAEEFLEIKLKVRQNASAGNTIIGINNQTTSEGKEDIEIEKSNININVIRDFIDNNEDQNNDNENNNDGQNDNSSSQDGENQNGSNNSQGGGNQNHNGQGNGNTNENNKVPPTTIPQTGENNFIFIAIEILILITIYFFIKYKKIDKKMKKKNKKLMTIILAIFLTVQIAGTTYGVVMKNVQKGEVNDDGLINYTDVELVEKHLIGLEKLSDDKLENADLNNDKRITVTDLTILIKKIENKREYVVELENISTENYYPSKNQEIEISFIGKINYEDVSIKKVIINGAEYNAEKTNEIGNEYKVKLNVGNIAEKKEFKFSKVILSTDEEVKIDYNFSACVLKDKPFMDEKSYKLEETFEGKANVSFSLVDTENSIISAQFTAYEKAENKILVETPIKVGNNKQEIPVKEGKTYIVEIEINYNLAPEQLTGNEHQGETIFYSKEFTVNLDYKLKISNLKTLKNDVANTTFIKKEPIQVSFDSTNAAFEETNNNTFKPTVVTINGKEYQVEEKDNHFVATIDGIESLGNQLITIEKVKLGNGKEIILDKNNSIQVRIEEQKPSISNFEAQENILEKNIKIKFDIIDQGKTIESAKVVLYDENKNIIQSKDLSKDEIKNGKIETILETKATTKYIVEVIASYRATDTEINKNKVILMQEVSAIIYANIKQTEINKTEVEKNESINITYEIETNSKQNIEKIRVNSVNYKAIKISNGKYKITIPVGSVAKLLNLETTKLIFEDGIEASVTNTLQVNVLKDIPTISDVSQEDSLGKHEVTLNFTINDADNSYISGKVQLLNKEQIVEEKEIIKDENGKGIVTFDYVEEDVLYTAKVLATYNRFVEAEDHEVKDQLIEEIPIILVHDYKLQVSNLKTANKNKETIYFNKNEEIIFSFSSTNASIFIPEDVIINGNPYKVTRKTGTDKYTVTLVGYDVSGKQEIKIEKVILSNGVALELSSETKIEIEILKEKPTIEDFSYNEDTENKNKIKAGFTLIDNEQTLVSGKIIITDQSKKEIKIQDLQSNNNEIIFDKTDSEYYYIKVVADYNLGTDENNLYKAQILLEDEMEFTTRKIEMKDVLDVYLYRKNGEKIEEVTSLYTYELENASQFLVKVEMKDIPAFYAPLKGYRVENNILKLELEYENVVQYENNMKQNKLEADYGTVENNKATNNSLASLIKRMKENPNGTYELTKDYDASTITGDHRSLVGADITFTGTLNGNGHKIYNLSKPIFDYVSRANIKDLVLENVHLSNTDNVTGRGVLSNETGNNTTISNVHVKNMTITTSVKYSYYGGITGKLTESTIKECSVTGLTITGPQNWLVSAIGGITGYINTSTIENSYVTGSISGRKEMGGIAGLVEKYVPDTSYIKNCIAKVNIDSSDGPNGIGGIVGFAKDAGQINLKQNISFATGRNSYKLYGTSATLNMFTKNYAMEESTLKDNNSMQIKKISKDDFDEDFCKKEAEFDENIWNLNGCSYDKLPTLNNADPNNVKEEQKQENEIYIPYKARLEKMTEYNKNKEILYSNLYKLMPFYDAKYLVLDGTKISEDDILNKELIKTILAYDNKGKLVVATTNENYKNLSYIKVVFDDNTTKKYNLKFKDTYGNIANYNINELNVDYNFDKYIIKQDATIVRELSNYIQSLEYEKDLQGMLSLDRGHPAYKVHFNEVVRKKENADNFIYKHLSSASGYSITMENEILNTIVKNKLNNNEMKKILFAYNYYSRFYGINMDGANLSDIMLFKGELYRENIKISDLISDFWNSRWKNSHVNYQYYRDTLAHRFGISQIGDFIEYNIKILTDNKNPNDWFTENFKGPLVEVQAKGHEESDIDYRAWTQLKKRPEYMLALLTLPENAGYMISTPTVFFVGSQRVYITDPTNKTQQQTLLNKMQNFANQVATFYGTAAGFIESKYFNNICDIAIDTRFLPELGEQFNAKTNDLFHKNFNEILNEWSMIGGVGAYAGSQRIYFVVNHALDSYSTWTHETGHNQTARLFFKNNGFRPIGGGASSDGISGSEDYTDGNTSQGAGDGDVNFNLSYNYNKGQLVTTNLSPERINSKEKIESYYRRMFETIDFLDYVEAKAFLELTPEEQSKVAVQIYYPNAPKDYSTVGWKTLSKEEFEKMKLQTVNDLWSNQITIKPGVTGNTTQTADGAYGSEGMYIRRWYQPYNENGRTHTYGFKYTAWQMLGIGGYDGGYVTYYSGKSKNDLDAIKKVTNDDTMTWQKFKQERYKLMEDSWNKVTYVNADELMKVYINALKIDAQNGDRNVTNSTNVRRRNYHYVKCITDDFRQEVLNGENEANKVHIKSAKEFKEKLTENSSGYYVLDNDIDLSSLTGEKAIIDGTFVGKLDGQGHKITGNTLPIFDSLKLAHISNLKLENTKITNALADVGALARKAEYSEIENVIGKKIEVSSTNKQIGGLIGSMTNSFVTNTHITDAITSGSSRVGMIAGYVGQSQIQESSANGKVTSKGNAIGGLVGEAYNRAIILNSYSIGNVQGNTNVGGLIGLLTNSSVTKSFSSATINGTNAVAGFIGKSTNNSIVQNNISLGNQYKQYKFDGATDKGQLNNYTGNYEYEDNTGTSTLDRKDINFDGKIKVVTKSEIINQNFYKNTLGWNENIWDFTGIVNEEVPRLKNLDPNKNIPIILRENINSVDEFIEKLSTKPDGRYTLTKDLDFSGKTYNLGSSVIPGTFFGVIDGNGHTIKNLSNASIFEQFSGTAQNLNIENFQYGVVWNKPPYTQYIDTWNSDKTQSNVGAFTKKSIEAKFYNMRFNRVIMTGNNSIAVITANDKDSTFEKINVTEAFIMTESKIANCGNKSSTFISEKTGGSIKNCYIQGEMHTAGSESGAVIGLSHGGIKIENVVANIIGRGYKEETAQNSGLFIGKIEGKTEIKNSISIGKTLYDILLNKFAMIPNAANIEFITNCYENADEQGISNSNGTNIKEVSKEQLLSKEFYRDILHLDENIWDLDNIEERNYSESPFPYSPDPTKFPKIIDFGGLKK